MRKLKGIQYLLMYLQYTIYENGLTYSARSIHNIMCRQLVTKKKHELWFVFRKKPLRFSLQEFYAVTGLNYKDEGSYDLENWTDDQGFWSSLLEKEDSICIRKLTDDHLPNLDKWTHVDMIRLVYICVGVVMAIEEKQKLPLLYIKLVMDLRNVQAYLWCLKSFQHLLTGIKKTKVNFLKRSNSYIMDGFSYAFQIWLMEAIPKIG